MSTKSGDAEDAPTDAPLSITKSQQRFATGLGILAFFTGAWAVFKSDNQAGTIGLLAAGGLLLILGLIGRFPEKGSVGSASWSYAPTIQALLDSPDEDVREAVAEEVVAQAAAAPSRHKESSDLVRRATSLLNERDAITRLERIIREFLPEADLTIEEAFPRPDGRIARPDLVLRPRGGASPFPPIPIEITGGRFWRASGRDAILRTADYAHACGSPVAILFGLRGGSDAAPEGEAVAAGIKVFLGPAYGPPETVLEVIRRAVEGARRLIDNEASE